MRFLKFFKSYNKDINTDINFICKKYGIKNYTINSDGSIDVDGDVYLSRKGLTKLPLKFRNISGHFDCYDNAITSLEGGPQSVGGDSYCNKNKLTSLEFSPQSVGGDFYCHDNKITSLEFSPKSVGGNFYCENNELISLEGAPESVGGHFDCGHNKLTSLEFSPKSIGGVFNCVNNKITSLESSPKYIGGHFRCFDNPLYNVWKLIRPDNNKWDSSIIELFNDYDCIRDGDIIMERFNDFLMEIGKDPVDKVEGYNNI